MPSFLPGPIAFLTIICFDNSAHRGLPPPNSVAPIFSGARANPTQPFLSHRFPFRRVISREPTGGSSPGSLGFSSSDQPSASTLRQDLSSPCSLDGDQRGASADRHLQGGSCAPPSPPHSARRVLDVLSDRPVLQEKDKLVNDVMRYVLFKTHQASGCPIKREELTGVVTKNYRQRALPTLVINEARDRLAATFGYEMRELQRTRAPSTRAGRASQPQGKASSYYFFLFSLHRSCSATTSPGHKTRLFQKFCRYRCYLGSRKVNWYIR